jgi:hypothetical protein
MQKKSTILLIQANIRIKSAEALKDRETLGNILQTLTVKTCQSILLYPVMFSFKINLKSFKIKKELPRSTQTEAIYDH